jgi:hypothetical protein
MHPPYPARAASSWFQGRAGRRFGLEMGLVVLAKLAALTLLYFVFIAPQPHADTSAASVRAHVAGAGPDTPETAAHDRR